MDKTSSVWNNPGESRPTSFDQDILSFKKKSNNKNLIGLTKAYIGPQFIWTN